MWVLVQKLLAISSQLVSSWEGIDKEVAVCGENRGTSTTVRVTDLFFLLC